MASDYERIRDDNLREYGQGTRHLEFFQRLYADRTHFVFELLQNAEDAGATSVRFDLYHDRLEVRHNGRPFDERDVRGVCGVGEGTKADDLTQIGKFGIGFKSVYAYSSCPEIHSGDEHFRIEHYVRPCAAQAVEPGGTWTTFFLLPFADPAQAFGEIEERFGSLQSQTLLFLRHISRIECSVEGKICSSYVRDPVESGSCRRVRLMERVPGQEDKESEWLVFERGVQVPEKNDFVRVEVAFKLARQGSANDTIVPIQESPLVVFFPTAKETDLGFLIQGAYRTTPARDNIPRVDSWNRQLVAETATLVADLLPVLRDMGLLTVGLLEAMPIRPQNFPEDGMFRAIFDRVRETLREDALLPAHGGGFVDGKQAKLARGAELRELLPEQQLRVLFEGGSDLKWLADKITADKTPELRNYLVEELGIEEVTPEAFARRFGLDFIAEQADGWVAKFYGFLDGQKALWRAPRWQGDSGGPLRDKPFVRLQDGSHVATFRSDGLPNAHLPPSGETDYPVVKREIVEQDEALQFLKNLGLKEPSTVTEVIEKVLPKYHPDAIDAQPLSADEHARDIEKVFRALKTDSQHDKDLLVGQLKRTCFLRATNVVTGQTSFKQPGDIYIRSTDLELYFAGNPNAYFLAAEYADNQVESLCQLGVSRTVRVQCRQPGSDGSVMLGYYEGEHTYNRGTRGFDPKYEIDGLEYAVRHPSSDKAVFVWNTLLVPRSHLIRGCVESATRSNFRPAKMEEKLSSAGRLVCDLPWLPSAPATFHRPQELSLVDLPDGFRRDEDVARALGMKAPVSEALAREAGVAPEDIEYLRSNIDEFRRWRTKRSKADFPVKESSSAELRSQSVAAQAKNARRKQYDPKTRSVRISDDLQGEAKTYLRELYTNDDGQMVCQACHDEMPFKLDDGSYYFEAVECVTGADREHRENHLALCPVCAAKYRYANSSDPAQVRESILQATGELRVPITLAREPHAIRFVEVHLQDLQAVLRSEVTPPD